MINNLDAVYAALSDASRRLMLERLKSGPLTVSELGAPLAMTLAAVGKHVSVLESAGIIRTAKSGRVRTCALVPATLTAATAWLSAQGAFWNERIDALVDHVEENP